MHSGLTLVTLEDILIKGSVYWFSLRTSLAFFPLNRKLKVMRLKKTQPKLKISALVVAAFLFNSSGAT